MFSIIEALLFVRGDEGLTVKELADVLEVDTETVNSLLQSMQTIFKEEGRGLQIVQFAGGFRLTTKPEHSEYLKKLAMSPIHSSLSQAALEILAIIAYRQPITRLDIEDIRGVRSDRALQTLMSKLLIKPVGRKPGVGRPILYGTTPLFLDHFGLNSLADLPPLQEEFDEQLLQEETDLFLQKLEETVE